jgi:hypothetical protein
MYKISIMVTANTLINLYNYYHFLGAPPVTALMEVQVPMMSTAECAKAYSNVPQIIIDERVLCAGFPEGGKDSCRVIVSFDYNI